MMKNLWSMLVMMVCILASCSDGGNEEPTTPNQKPEEVIPEVTIDASIVSNGLSFNAAKGESTLSFTTNTNWSLSIAETRSGTDWCTAFPTSGGKGTANVKFTTTENTEYEDRSVAITIKAGAVNKTFRITQKAADALLVTTTKYEVPKEGGQIEIEVKSNIDYQMAISETAKVWITESKSRTLKTHKHILDIAANEDANKREGEITFKSGNKVETVKVYQAGEAVLLLSQSEYTVSDAGETISVDIKSNVEYDVQMPDADWITDESSSRGLSSHTMKFAVTANGTHDCRSAEIIFSDKNSELKDTLKVLQVQKDAIILSQKEVDVKSEGETIEVKLSANVDFEVTMPDVDWVNQTESRALTEHILYFKIAKNTGGESRNATISFINKASELSEHITITQLGKEEIALDPSIKSSGLSFKPQSGKSSISFTTNTDWTLSVASTSSGAIWCTPSATSGSKGSASIEFTVAENTDYEDRSVVVTIKAGEATETFTVTQKGVDALLLTTKKYEVPQEGGSIDIEVKSNVSYQMEISEDAKSWITESSGRALAAYKHTLSIAANESTEKREGEIRFKSGDKEEVVKIYQAGVSTILLTKNEYNLSSAGETITVDIKSNIEFAVQMPDVDWIIDEATSRGMSSHTLKYVVAANNTYDNRSAEIVFYDKNSDLKETLKIVQAQKDGIVLSQKEYEVKAEGKTIEVKLSTNVDFEVVMPDVDWVNQMESRALTEHILYFKIAKNTGGESRNATISFINKASELSEQITITQQGKEEIILDSSIQSNGLSFQPQSGKSSVSFTTNTDWTLSVASTSSGAIWCTPSATSGSKGSASVEFAVTENTDYEDRSVVVTIKAGEATETFTVTQKGVDALLLTTKKYEVPQEGGSIDIEVKSNVSYQMEISEDAKSWITESSGRSLTAYKHALSIAANESTEKREGEIRFKSGDKEEVVKIYQAGVSTILLTKNEYNVSSAGETITVDIKSNIEFAVQMPDVDWITDEAISRGMSSHTLKYVVAANNTYDNRSAEIVFYDKNSDLKETLKIVQAQKDAIVISQKDYEVKAEGGNFEVKLSSNVEFEVTMPEVDWISQETSRALTEHTLYFTVDKNTGENDRTAEIVFKNKQSGLSEKIVVTQKCPVGYYADGVVTIKVPGNMKYLLGNDYLNITSLKVVGPINGDDVRSLRQMLGSYGFVETGKLTTLDLSGASIVAGGGWYNVNDDIQYYTSDNSIGECMFEWCSNLKSIVMPNSVTSIGVSAFYGCKALTSINFGNSVTKIDENAFRDCDALVSLDIPDHITSLGSYAFYDCNLLFSVTINAGTIGQYAFSACPTLASVRIGDNVTKVGQYTFYGCKAMTSVTIGSGVTSLGNYAFYGCSLLTSILIPDKMTSLGDYVFANCSKLTSIVIPDNVTSLGDCAFRNCYALETVTIGNGLTKIGTETFYDCRALTLATIGSGITSIGGGAFRGAYGFQLYCYATTPPQIVVSPYGVPSFDKTYCELLHVPDECKSKYVESISWRSSFKNITGIY